MTGRQAGESSPLIPVYSKWKPAAETLMSDWKVKYRLLDVLFSSWGIVVPGIDNMEETGEGLSSPHQRFRPTKDAHATTHKHMLQLSDMLHELCSCSTFFFPAAIYSASLWQFILSALVMCTV